MGRGKSRKLAEIIAKEELSSALNNNEIDNKFFTELDWKEFNKLIKKGHLNNPIISKIKKLL